MKDIEILFMDVGSLNKKYGLFGTLIAEVLNFDIVGNSEIIKKISGIQKCLKTSFKEIISLGETNCITDRIDELVSYGDLLLGYSDTIDEILLEIGESNEKQLKLYLETLKYYLLNIYFNILIAKAYLDIKNVSYFTKGYFSLPFTLNLDELISKGYRSILRLLNTNDERIYIAVASCIRGNKDLSENITMKLLSIGSKKTNMLLASKLLISQKAGELILETGDLDVIRTFFSVKRDKLEADKLGAWVSLGLKNKDSKVAINMVNNGYIPKNIDTFKRMISLGNIGAVTFFVNSFYNKFQKAILVFLFLEILIFSIPYIKNYTNSILENRTYGIEEIDGVKVTRKDINVKIDSGDEKITLAFIKAVNDSFFGMNYSDFKRILAHGNDNVKSELAINYIPIYWWDAVLKSDKSTRMIFFRGIVKTKATNRELLWKDFFNKLVSIGGDDYIQEILSLREPMITRKYLDYLKKKKTNISIVDINPILVDDILSISDKDFIAYFLDDFLNDISESTIIKIFSSDNIEAKKYIINIPELSEDKGILILNLCKGDNDLIAEFFKSKPKNLYPSWGEFSKSK